MTTTDSVFQRALSNMLTEIFEGPPGQEAYLLNPGDPGLLRQLDTIEASAASKRPMPGKMTIAAHVDHIRFGLSILNRWAAGFCVDGIVCLHFHPANTITALVRFRRIPMNAENRSEPWTDPCSHTESTGWLHARRATNPENSIDVTRAWVTSNHHSSRRSVSRP
jgi:hypothetical protein